MKKGLVFLLVIFLTLAFLRPVLAAEKIGYADAAKIFDEYQKTKDYDKILEAKAQDLDKEATAKDTELRQLEDNLKLLSDKEKEKKQKEITDKRKDAQQSLVLKADEIRKERNDKAKEILKDIESVVSDYAQKEGYTIIFDSRNLIYNNKANDGTESILKLLQSRYKKGPADK